MKHVLIAIIVGIVMMSTTAFAHSINFEWDRNTEVDMDHYVVYKCPSGTSCGVGSGRVVIGPSIAQPATGTVVGWTYAFTPPVGTEEIQYFACTASDASGNESGPSNIVNTRVDNKPPGNPGGLKILMVIP